MATNANKQDAGKKFIKRITLFKIPKDEDVESALGQYKILRKNAVKDGKPYILHNEAAKTLNASEERSQGYTLVSQTTFASMDDVMYYDKQCEAHNKFKEVVSPMRTGVACLHIETDVAPHTSG